MPLIQSGALAVSSIVMFLKVLGTVPPNEGDLIGIYSWYPLAQSYSRPQFLFQLP